MSDIYATVGPVFLCRLPYEPGDKRISYYKNVYYLRMIKELGRKYKEEQNIKNQESYSIGISIIQGELLRRNINVSKKQIRRLGRPNYKKLNVIKFPFQTLEILQVLHDTIHNCSQNKELTKACKNKKKALCIKCNQDNMLCRDFLIGDLYKCLNMLRGTFVANRGAMHIVEGLDRWLQNCNVEHNEQ